MLVLPFWLDFDPAARGIGAVTERRSFARWAGDMALIYGVLGWGVLAAYAGRLLAARQRVRIAAWGGVGAAFVLSLLAPVDLSGVAAARSRRSRSPSTRRSRAGSRRPSASCGCSSPAGVACVLAPELVYVRDEFDDSALYRMNTVFKLGYQAFLLLAIAAACALPWAGRWLPRRAWAGWAAVGAVLLLLGLVFPYAGNWARRDGFSRSPTLERARLAARERARRRRGDRVAARATPPTTPCCSRPPARTTRASATRACPPSPGRPTVIGWAGHELQWKHDPGRRADDVRAMYTSTDADADAARCSTATGSATSSSGRSSARTTATPGSPSGTSWGGGCSTGTARRSGTSGERQLRWVGRRGSRPRRPAPRASSELILHA